MPPQETVLVQGPGYYTMGEEQYHADPAPKPSLSASIATILITDTPADARYAHKRLTPTASLPPHEQEMRRKKDEEKTFDQGNVSHMLLLGQEEAIEVLPFDNWMTKAAKEARTEAFENGLQPCLERVFDIGASMSTAARRQLADDPENFDAFDPTAGDSELTVLWQEQTAPGKMWMRAKMDRLMKCRRRIYDYKTFAPGAEPDGFVKYLFREGRDIQDPFYSRGVASVEGVAWDQVTFKWIVQCPKPPYILSTIELMHDADVPEDQRMEGSHRSFSAERAQWAIDEWARCASTGEWLGYVPRTHLAAAPGYAQAAWAMKVQQHEAGLQILRAAKAAEQ